MEKLIYFLNETEKIISIYLFFRGKSFHESNHWYRDVKLYLNNSLGFWHFNTNI